MLYINENKEIANRWLSRIGLQLPSAADNYGYIGRITETEEKVNISGGIPYKNLAGYPDTNEPPTIDDTEQIEDYMRIGNIFRTQQFKRWFGKSVVVNEDGTPKVLYALTDSSEDYFPFLRSVV